MSMHFAPMHDTLLMNAALQTVWHTFPTLIFSQLDQAPIRLADSSGRICPAAGMPHLECQLKAHRRWLSATVFAPPTQRRSASKRFFNTFSEWAFRRNDFAPFSSHEHLSESERTNRLRLNKITYFKTIFSTSLCFKFSQFTRLSFGSQLN